MFTLWAFIVVMIAIGWIKSIVKAANCNFDPIGKAEVVYVIGSLIPPAGGVIGWIDVKDE